MSIKRLGSKTKLNDTSLTIRLPQVISDQLVSISKKQFKPPSQVVRDLIIEYIKNNQAILIAPSGMTISPSQYKPSNPNEISEDEFDEAWR
jgi:predicted DNA-binding protein